MWEWGPTCEELVGQKYVLLASKLGISHGGYALPELNIAI